MSSSRHCNELHKRRNGKRGLKKTGIPKTKLIKLDTIRKIIQSIFYRDEIEVTIHIPKIRRNSTRNNEESENMDQKEGNETPRKTNKERNTEALIIKKKNVSYAELVKAVREEVISKGLQEDIKAVKESKQGKLLITLETGKNCQQLKEIIETKTQAEEIRISRNTGKRKVLHIKDIDFLTTKEEILKSVADNIENDDATAEIVAIKPGYGKTQIATINLNENEASRLLELNKLKIGISRCRVLEQTKVQYCYRCWEYGHLKKDCAGPDRSQACRNCSKEGHKTRNVRKKVCVRTVTKKDIKQIRWDMLNIEGR